MITVQIINFCIDGEFNYDKVIKIAKESFDGVTDLKVCMFWKSGISFVR